MFVSRAKIIENINRFSTKKTPFVFAIDFAGEKGFVLSPEDAVKHGLQYDIGGMKNAVETHQRTPLKFEFFPAGFKTYKKAFEKVIFHLKRGDTYLLNLTFPTSLEINLSLDELFAYSSALYKLLVPGSFVVFSPEVFVRISDGHISCCPMKGTIDAAIPDAEQRLLSDEKEFFEHNTIVDLIRNDLSMVSTNVKVSRFRYIDRIHTHRGDLLQQSSEITGTLPAGYHRQLGEILFTLLPAGSVTGAPKEKTVEIIRATETYDRGFYTGIFGFFDGQSLTS
ncbi:MAG: aminodeoxychorismate synthase component I, partial [Bacteroidota bacterium]